MHPFSPHSISVCAERHRSNVFAFKTAQPARHWQHLYIPEMEKKAMATAVVGTRREFHQLAEGGDETTVLSKREVKYGSNQAWLWEDCAIIPDVLSLGQDLSEASTLQIHTPPQIYGLLSITHNLSISNIHRIKRQQISIVSKIEPA